MSYGPPGFANLLNPAYTPPPETMNVPQIDINSILSGATGPGTLSDNATQAIESGLAPQFAQQQGALTAALANAGIVGGTAPAAASALGTQQQQTLQAAIQPLIAQYAGMGLQGALANQGAQQQVGEFNIGNLIQNAMSNSGTYNQMAQYLAGLQNNDWLAQLQAETGLSQGAAGAQTGAFEPVYTQPQPINFNAGSFAPMPNVPSPTTGLPSSGAAGAAGQAYA